MEQKCISSHNFNFFEFLHTPNVLVNVSRERDRTPVLTQYLISEILFACEISENNMSTLEKILTKAKNEGKTLMSKKYTLGYAAGKKMETKTGR